MSLKASLKQNTNYVLLALSGKGLSDADFENANNLLSSELNKDNNNLIIDLKDLDLINSLGLNFLIKLFTKCRNLGGEMYIVNISDKINQVLLLTKLNTVLNIAKSIDEAKNNFDK
jgi:anti-sigma B factor antagonist